MVSICLLPAASSTVLITLPLVAHGVGIDRLSRCAAGILASIWLSVSLVLATRPSSRTKAAMPSTVRAHSGTTNPPRPSAAKMTSSCAAATVSASIDVGVQLTRTPWKRQTCSATLVVVTGRATSPDLRSAATRSSTASSARSSLTSSPFSSTSWIRSPSGSNLTPNAAR